MIGGKGETQVEVKAICTTKAKGFQNSDISSATYTLTGVIADRNKAAGTRTHTTKHIQKRHQRKEEDE